MTSKKASGMSKTAQKGILKEDGSLDTLFSRLWEKFKVFQTLKNQMESKMTSEQVSGTSKRDKNYIGLEKIFKKKMFL